LKQGEIQVNVVKGEMSNN